MRLPLGARMLRSVQWTLMLLAALAQAQSIPIGGDAREIVLRSAEFGRRDIEIRRNYTFLTLTEQRTLDREGKVQKTESRTDEVLILYGRPYARRIAKDGKPLPADEERKEKEKIDKEVARRGRESPSQQAKRAREEDADVRRQREILKEVADAFDFRLRGEEEVEGVPAWVIDAEPRVGYRGRSRETRILPNFRGRVWITQQDYRWVKVDAEVIRRISIGLFLARLDPGASIQFEQQRVQDEIWMPLRVYVRAAGRLALLKRFNTEVQITYSNYRKFQSDSRITGTMEVAPAAR